jgi:hypothetical protein
MGSIKELLRVNNYIALKYFSGRLGNWMHQYAYMRSMSEKLNTRFSIPNFYYNKKNMRTKYYHGLDDIFVLRDNRIKYVAGLAETDLKRNITESDFGKPYGQYHIGLDFPNILDNAMYSGTFQSYKYYSKRSCSWFKFRGSYVLDIIKDKIFQNKRCVGVHLRLGDILKNKRLLRRRGGLCSDNYYNKAFKITECEKVIVFSDNITLAKEIFSRINYGDREVVFSENRPDYEDMYMLNRCEDKILCDSTFSWWAGYMNHHKNKGKVMSPRKWYSDKIGTKTEDINIKEWVLIDKK